MKNLTFFLKMVETIVGLRLDPLKNKIALFITLDLGITEPT